MKDVNVCENCKDKKIVWPTEEELTENFLKDSFKTILQEALNKLDSDISSVIELDWRTLISEIGMTGISCERYIYKEVKNGTKSKQDLGDLIFLKERFTEMVENVAESSRENINMLKEIYDEL